ncbi:cell wall metabolism sensor histidine kinase WalK [Demequina sp. NBRC 110052]|uniref:sensor histidine kinase n=1 Tax=Demequina sp. NBRC 110052 TaxID=1570341 RepID=UPI001F262015|nr:ATP-binding protein [Demequina sp. NBRC 110052]
MNGWLKERGLATRLVMAFGAVVVVTVVVVWFVDRAIAPRVLEQRLRGMMRHGMMSDLLETQRAAASSSAMALAIALVVAVAAAALVSVLVARRVGASLGALGGAVHRVADGEYGARVPSPGMGREFDELADSINVMTERLEHSERLRQRAIGDVAHELRTPVATIAGYLEGLEDGVAELTPETVAMLRAQAARLTRLSEDLSAVSRAEAGQVRLDLVEHDPAELLATARAASVERAAAAEVALELDAPGDLPRVRVDLERMAQVLGNLVDNALRHTPAGGAVALSARRSGEGVALSVADTGSGIAAEHLPYVFERFYRADEARDRASGGSGVGLAIVRALVQAHGGTVEVASSGVGHGATFTVTLPAL